MLSEYLNKLVFTINVGKYKNVPLYLIFKYIYITKERLQKMYCILIL
jgi:hypothetical protein